MTFSNSSTEQTQSMSWASVAVMGWSCTQTEQCFKHSLALFSKEMNPRMAVSGYSSRITYLNNIDLDTQYNTRYIFKWHDKSLQYWLSVIFYFDLILFAHLFLCIFLMSLLLSSSLLRPCVLIWGHSVLVDFCDTIHATVVLYRTHSGLFRDNKCLDIWPWPPLLDLQKCLILILVTLLWKDAYIL